MSNARIMLAKKKVQGVKTIEPDAHVITALYLMRVHNIGALVVMHEGAFLGIITERDVVRKLEIMGRSAQFTLVRDIWTCCDDIATVSPDATFQDCLDLMSTKNVRHVPVIEGEGEHAKVIGVISIRDIVNELATKQIKNDDTRENLPPS